MARNKESENKKAFRLKFFDPQSFSTRLKATIHKTGKLGFTLAASKKMGLAKGKRASIGINQDDPADKSLYILINDAGTKDGSIIAKAGDYYYIKMDAIFDKMGIDYKSRRVIFDITEQDYNGRTIYKLSNIN